MATFALIHGAGDVGWYWHLVEPVLRGMGHDVVAPDLPCEDDAASFLDYVDAVVDAVGDRRDLVVVGHSYGGFTAPLVADRVPVDLVVYVAGMVPAAGEQPAEWWDNTGCRQAVREQARRDGGLTGSDDPVTAFYHDVPAALAEEALRRGRSESAAAYDAPWPRDARPTVASRVVACTQDRIFPLPFMRRVAAERLGVVPDEIAAGHCVALSRPVALGALLDSYTRPPGS